MLTPPLGTYTGGINSNSRKEDEKLFTPKAEYLLADPCVRFHHLRQESSVVRAGQRVPDLLPIERLPLIVRRFE